MESAPPEAPDGDYFVLKQGECTGPWTIGELRAGLEEGRFAPGDLVQHGRLPIWRRIERALATTEGKGGGEVVPEWRAIGRGALARMERDVRTASVATAGVFLTLGTGVWLCSRWPLLLWLPWFLPPVIAGVLALTRGRLRRGLLLLLPVAAVAAASTLLPPAGAPPTPAPVPLARVVSVVPVVPVAPPPAPPALVLPPPTTGPAPVPVPAPPPAPAAQPDPEPVLGTVRQLPPLPPEPPAALKPEPALASAPVAPGDLVQAYRDCFILVQGGEGHGSGFICRLAGRTVLLTNTHVVAGLRQPQFTQLSGARVAVGAAEAAVGADLLRLALPAPPARPLEALADLEAQARIGDEVVVLGNTGGGGVVTSLEGRLVGLGPDRIEVSSRFIPGNSGSPIVHVKTGRVIGIATYLTKRYEEFGGATQGPQEGDIVVRRFGYRIDRVQRWEPVDWSAFYAEAAQMKKIAQLTGDVFDFLSALQERREPQFATETLRRSAMDWVGRTGRSGLSEVDRRSATQSFLGSLRTMVRADVAAAETGLRYSFFRDELRQEREIRDRLYKAFDDQVRRMASPSARGGF